MRRFNPEKELSKIKNGNKKKIIISICALLLVGVIGYSFALYQVRHSNKLTHITVKQFYQNDLDLAVYVDGVKKVTEKDFPTKENGTNLIYTGIKCEDGKQVNASWDYNDWSLILESKLPNKCNIYFETRYKDNSGASYPELYQGLIPVKYDNGEIHIADLASEWYDYDKHNWANAVLVTNEAYKRIVNEDGSVNTNEPISLDTDILQMYVWIPRYRYKLWNAKYENSNPQMIEIEFESNTTGRSIGSNNGQWLTHPAFLFGDTELNGFWVGKFEPSDAKDEIGRNSEIGEITILPNKTSMVNKTIKIMFDAEQKLSEEGNKYNLDPNEVDTHMARNMEWGAVAYLTSSKYGIYINANTCVNTECEIWINNIVQGTGSSGVSPYGGTATGCVGDSVSDAVKWGQGGTNPAICPTENQWNSTKGVNASTTGNVYGIYDMSGGAWEYVMGVIKEQNGDTPYWNTSGFEENTPEAKYYDLYDFSDKNITHERGHLGDATRETLKIFENSNGGWNGDYAQFPFMASDEVYPWFVRGGTYDNVAHAGIFAIYRWHGGMVSRVSFRSVLTAQDGMN